MTPEDAEKSTSQEKAYRRILVAFDGSDNARRALRRAIELAKQSGAELFMVSAADSTRYADFPMISSYGTLRSEMLEHTNKLLADASEIARAAGIKNPTGAVGEGHPVDVILTQALGYKVDLIVVGRRGIRGVERFVAGSVSSAVVSHSEADVLVVK